MSLLITGEVDRLTERTAGSPGNQWTEHTAVVVTRGATYYVVLGGDLLDEHSKQPVGLAPGDRVVLEVGVRGYVRKTGDVGVGYTGYRRNSEAEKALYHGPALRAANAS